LSLLLGSLAAGCALDAKDVPQSSTGTTYEGPEEITLVSPEARLVLKTHPFALRVEDSQGKVVLASLPEEPVVASDTVGAYTALGATHIETETQIAITEGWDHVLQTEDPWRHASQVTAATSTGDSAELTLIDPSDPGTTYALNAHLIGADVQIAVRIVASEPRPSDTGPLNQLGLAFSLDPKDKLFGLGERLSTVNHSGMRYGTWVEEGGVGQGENTPAGPNNPSPNGPGMTHYPTPFLLSSKGFGLFLEGTYRASFAMGSDAPSALRFTNEATDLKFHVFVHASAKDSIDDYTRLTGRPPRVAPWVFGPRRRVDHGVMVAGVPEAEALRSQHVPTTMIDDTNHFLPIASQVGHEQETYDWNQMARDLGYKSIAYFNPYVSVDDPRAKALYKYGHDHGYFIKLDDGSELNEFVISAGPQTVATIDLTNPDAVTWYQSLLQEALDFGYDGWMLDFAEYVTQRAVLFDGRTGLEAHNAFPVIYDGVVFDYLTKMRGDDFMFYSRAGYAGSQAKTPVVWSGDPAASYDDHKGLPAQVRAGINSGLSGIPYWGSDISGYACLSDPSPDKTLYLRWAAFGALSSDMHDENACAQKPANQPDKWTLWSDAETTAIYGDFARLHTRLNPYLLACAEEAHATGMPVMRHPLLMHPETPAVYDVELEYYFGPSLYVAPLVRRFDTSRTLVLPPGTWVDWYTWERKDGEKKVIRQVPLSEIAMYVRSGGLVPLLDPSVETLAPEHGPSVIGADDMADVLDVRGAIGATETDARFTLAEGGALSAHLSKGAVALPMGFTLATTEADLATCSACGLIEDEADGVKRLRLSTIKTSDSILTAGGLSLRHHLSHPTRVRWDLAIL
jgi:alpha-glucosidase (family GH31 glycosyl hydrolase)